MLSLVTPWSRIPPHLIHRIYPSNSYTFAKNLVSFTSKTSNTAMDPNVMGREIDLLETKDTRFRLPGNVGIFVNENWMLKLNNLNNKETNNKNLKCKKNLIRTISREELVQQWIGDKPMPNSNSFYYEDKKNLHCQAHECPMLLVKDFQELFPRNPVNLSKGLTVLTITHKTENDMASWSQEVDCEREKLLEKFVSTAERMCTFLKDNGYWADFIDPSSGRPYYGHYTPATFFETDERYRRFGFEIEDLGCCKVLLHKLWGSNAFVGALFTNAPTYAEPVKQLIVSLDD